jgi:hypothetical protein
MLRPTKPTPRASDNDSYSWMVRLAERLARRDRLREMAAPPTIIEAELELVEQAKSKLTPAQVLFVMRQRDELIRYFDPAERSAEGRERAGDKAMDPS